ncbi:MAG: PAS domain-containing protein [Elusimicrobia bacterium]|nr:PAS domain-containing protein [Elusimicrobiota bacterium]
MATNSPADGDAASAVLQLAAHIDEALWMLEPSTGRILYASPATAFVWGVSPEDLYADLRCWLAHVHEEDRERAAECLRGKEFRDDEYRVLRPDGSVRWVRGRSFPVRDAAGRVTRVAGLAEDVTGRREMVAALQQREAELLQAQKMEAIGRLAGSVAHDFNNMLTVILGYSQHLLEDGAEGAQRKAELEQIARSAQKAGALTHQLLTFSRRQVVEPVLLDLNTVVADMQKMLRRLIGDDIEVVVSPSKEPAFVVADPVQMSQVIMNLAVNARDAMPKGGRITATTSHAALRAPLKQRHGVVPPGDYVLLSVSDTGCGMDEAVQAHLFEPFFTTKEAGKGTGLGLAILFGIVSQAAGQVVCDSAPGRGTTFHIYLPTAKEGDAPTSRTEASSPASLRGSETVMLVEDEEAVRQVARMSLVEAGYKVLEASGPAEAMWIAGRHHGTIDILVTDIVMLQMNGFELAEKLLPVKPGMRLMFMSGYTEIPIPEAHRGVPFLPKPFTPRTLLQRLRAALEAPAR